MEQSIRPKRVNLTLNEWDNFMHSMNLERGGREEEAVRPRKSLARTKWGRICVWGNAVLKGKENWCNMNKIRWTHFFVWLLLLVWLFCLFCGTLSSMSKSVIPLHHFLCCILNCAFTGSYVVSRHFTTNSDYLEAWFLHYVGDTGVSLDLYYSNHIKIAHFIDNT